MMDRGSDWNRWDLHVHSPASFESDFKSPADDATWEKYALSLTEAIQKHEVVALSFQDYFTTSGYDELIAREIYDPEERCLYANGKDYPVLIIPGMEVRLDNFTSKEEALNIHFYFDPTFYSSSSIKVFLRELECYQIAGQPITAEESDLVQYGYSERKKTAIDRSLDVDKLPPSERYASLFEAVENATVSKSHIYDALEKYSDHHGTHRSPILTGVAATGHGAVSDLNWHGKSGIIRREITRFADFVLSSNSKDHQFYLGNHSDAPTERLAYEIGGRKACIWGSDAHATETLLHPSGGDTDRYLWIKAEPTFDGLRQLQYEPASRCRVQEEHPQTKAKYRTIRKLSLNSGDYADCEVYFNRNLSVIIGGKSSGKSFLLYALASTMDRNSAAARQNEESTIEWYNQALEATQAEVTWDDDTKFSFTEAKEAPRVVSYIPQGYINRLAEKPKKLNEFVLDVLGEREGFKEQRADLERAVKKKAQEVKEKVSELVAIKSEEEELLEERRKLGDRDGINAEIKSLNEELERLKDRSTMSSEERVEYEKLKRRSDRLRKYLKNIKLSISELEALEDKIVETHKSFTTSIKAHKDSLDVLGAHFAPFASSNNLEIKKAMENWRSMHKQGAEEGELAVRNVIKRYKSFLEEFGEKVEHVEGQLEPYEDKLSLRDEVRRLEKTLQNEQDKLNRMGEIDDARQELISQFELLIEEIAASHGKLFIIRQQKTNEIRAFLEEEARANSNSEELLQVIVRPITKGKALTSRLNNMLDGRRAKADTLDPFFEDVEGYDFTDYEEHVSIIGDLLSAIIEADKMNELGFKEEYEAENILSELTDDWFDVQYSLSYEGETIISMSPGQRGMVLLHFLLERSEADNPILLDQPEDNLDNRTIYHHVVEAIRRRKIDRQIIIVTHEPNLTVATDAEQVIVAEQTSQQAQEDGTDRFRYATGALESQSLTVELDPEITTVRDWVCEILEGGTDAFRDRQIRYNLPPHKAY